MNGQCDITGCTLPAVAYASILVNGEKREIELCEPHRDLVSGGLEGISLDPV